MTFNDFLKINEIKALFNCPENLIYHPEGNTGGHVVKALEWLNANCPSEYKHDCYIATLLHDIGKPLTEKEKFPKHPKHDVLGAEFIANNSDFRKAVEDIYGVVDWKFVENVCRYHMVFWHFKDRNKRTSSFLTLLEDVGYKNIDKFLWCVFADNCSNDNVNDKSYVTLFQLCKDLFKDLKNICDKVIEPSHKYKQWKNMYWETKVRVCSDVVNTFNKESKIVVFDDLVQSFMNMLKKKEGSQISNDSVSINKENSTLWFNVNNVNYVIEVFDLQKCNCRVITPDLFEFRFSTDFNIWFVRFK